jgi:hypothetical protein
MRHLRLRLTLCVAACRYLAKNHRRCRKLLRALGRQERLLLTLLKDQQRGSGGTGKP